MISDQLWAPSVQTILDRANAQIHLDLLTTIPSALERLSAERGSNLYQLILVALSGGGTQTELVLELIRGFERGLMRPPIPLIYGSQHSASPGLLARYPQTLHILIPEGQKSVSLLSAAVIQTLSKLDRFKGETD